MGGCIQEVERRGYRLGLRLLHFEEWTYRNDVALLKGLLF